MKLTHLLAAGLMVAGLGFTSTAASAQDRRDDRGYHQRDDRRDYRRDERHDYREHGRHHGWNARQRRCHTEWRHHRRVTVCYR